MEGLEEGEGVGLGEGPDAVEEDRGGALGGEEVDVDGPPLRDSRICLASLVSYIRSDLARNF